MTTARPPCRIELAPTARKASVLPRAPGATHDWWSVEPCQLSFLLSGPDIACLVEACDPPCAAADAVVVVVFLFENNFRGPKSSVKSPPTRFSRPRSLMMAQPYCRTPSVCGRPHPRNPISQPVLPARLSRRQEGERHLADDSTRHSHGRYLDSERVMALRRSMACKYGTRPPPRVSGDRERVGPNRFPLC